MNIGIEISIKLALNTLLVHCVCAIKIISQDICPNITCHAEIKDSSIQNLEKFTICGRFRTPEIPHMPNYWQNILYFQDMWLLGRIHLRNCEDRYTGCTAYYRNRLGTMLYVMYLL